MEIRIALARAIEKLQNAKIKNPRIDAEILLSHILKKDKVFLFAYPEKKLTKIQWEKFNDLLVRRIKSEPIAYLIGYKYFYGNKFLVNRNTLIPRPETEIMIEEIMNSKFQFKNYLLFDVGAGSGCIIISLAKKLNSARPNLSFEFYGLDISQEALDVAKKNAKLNKVNKKINFLRGNLLEPILKNKKINLKNKNLIITANLPYVCKNWKSNRSPDALGLKFEPKIALFAKENGLEFYKSLFRQINKIRKMCASCLILCEIDHCQNTKIKKLTKQELPKAKIEIKKDLAGLDRLAVIKN